MDHFWGCSNSLGPLGQVIVKALHSSRSNFVTEYMHRPWKLFNSLRPRATYVWVNRVQLMHNNDVIMSVMASQITSLMSVYSNIYSGADQSKHQSPASLAFVQEIHRWQVNSLHKGPVMWKMSPFDDVIMDLTTITSTNNDPILNWSHKNKLHPNLITVIPTMIATVLFMISVQKHNSVIFLFIVEWTYQGITSTPDTKVDEMSLKDR